MGAIFDFLAHCAKKLLASDRPQIVVIHGRPSRAQWVREAREPRKAL